MPQWYTRQSDDEIVTDQVIEPSDFNNEFDALVTAFVQAFASTAGVGHGHTGTAGAGQLIALTGTSGVTGVTGVLAAQFGGVKTSTSDPSATDDTPDYVPGSRWVNTTSKTTFVCTDATASAAVWQKLQGVSSASLPTVNDDIADGYQVGHIWYYTGVTPAVPYICGANTVGAAVWVPMGTGRHGTSTSAPVVTDSATFGWREGSVMVDTVADQAYVCVDATAGAAVWRTLGAEATWTVVSSSTTVSSGSKNLIDTSAGSFGITFPAASTDDIRIQIADYALTLDASPLHITGSFQGVTGTFIVDVKGFTGDFVSKNGKFRMV